MVELFRRSLIDRSRSLIGWCVGVVLYVAMTAAVFPSIHGSPEFDKLVDNYPDVLKKMFGMSGSLSFTSGKGYVDAELFSFMLPAFAITVAIAAGASLVAGDEEHGLLDVWLACPVSRTTLLVSRAAVVALECIVFAGAVVAALAVADLIVGFDLVTGRLLMAGVSLALLGLFHGWLALAVGAATRHRSSAIGIPAAVAALGYLVATLHEIARWLDPFRWLSPFYYAGRNPLEAMVDPARLSVLLVATLAAVAAATIIFERRDVATA